MSLRFPPTFDFDRPPLYCKPPPPNTFLPVSMRRSSLGSLSSSLSVLARRRLPPRRRRRGPSQELGIASATNIPSEGRSDRTSSWLIKRTASMGKRRIGNWACSIENFRRFRPTGDGSVCPSRSCASGYTPNSAGSQRGRYRGRWRHRPRVRYDLIMGERALERPKGPNGGASSRLRTQPSAAAAVCHPHDGGRGRCRHRPRGGAVARP